MSDNSDDDSYSSSSVSGSNSSDEDETTGNEKKNKEKKDSELESESESESDSEDEEKSTKTGSDESDESEKSESDNEKSESDSDSEKSDNEKDNDSGSQSDDESPSTNTNTSDESESSEKTETESSDESEFDSSDGNSKVSKDEKVQNEKESKDGSTGFRGPFAALREKLRARKEKKVEEKEEKAEKSKTNIAPKIKPISWYYTDLPILTSDFGFKSTGTEHAMMAVGICSKMKPTITFEPHNAENTLARMLETSEWDEMGHWDRKGRFTKAQMKRKKVALCPNESVSRVYKFRDYTGPPRNMTEHIYIDHAIHPSTPYAHFSGGPIVKAVLGQYLYTDFADSIDKFKRPYSSGSEETGLKEDGYFLFVYTVNKV